MFDIAALDLSQDKPLSFDTRRYLVGLAIQSLYQDLAVMTEPVLKDRHIATLPIRITEWDLTHQEDGRSKSEDVSFFEPMSEADYNCYRIVATREAKVRLKGYKRVLDKRPRGISALRIAYCLCTSLTWVVTGARRAGIPKSEHGHERSLGSFTGWFHQDFYDYGVPGSCCDAIFNNRGTKPRTEYAGYWRRFPNADTKYKPHLMLTLMIDCDGEEGLLRVEVLTILAAMKGRLTHPNLIDHIIFPIMLFSFMGRQVRMIQAYYDGQELVIRKSQFLAFRDSATAPMDLLARYVANKPVGQTRRFPQQILGQSTESAFCSTSKTNAIPPDSANHLNGLPAEQFDEPLIVTEMNSKEHSLTQKSTLISIKSVQRNIPTLRRNDDQSKF